MRYEYVFYERDVSFDYGDFYGACRAEFEKSGFSVDIDRNDNVDIESLEGFGDFLEMEKEIKTHKDLRNFIEENKDKIEDYDPDIFSKYKNVELFEELVEILQEQF